MAKKGDGEAETNFPLEAVGLKKNLKKRLHFAYIFWILVGIFEPRIVTRPNAYPRSEGNELEDTLDAEEHCEGEVHVGENVHQDQRRPVELGQDWTIKTQANQSNKYYSI